MPLTLTDEQDAWEVACLVHRRWSEAFDARKRVREEKPDYKLEPDWDAFHKLRLAKSEADFAKWDTLKKKIAPQLKPLI